MITYSLTKEDLEDWGESFKTAIVSALVSENIIELSVADEWCASHTVILKKKSIFKTISNLFSNATSEDRSYRLLVVKGIGD